MALKNIILLIVFGVISVLLFQNFQQISLVFLGINFLSLPLSIILFIFFLGGLISSLIIQLIIKVSLPKYPQFYSAPPTPVNNNPPSTNPRPSYQYQEPPIYEDDTPDYIQSDNQFSSPNIKENIDNINQEDFGFQEIEKPAIKTEDNRSNEQPETVSNQEDNSSQQIELPKEKNSQDIKSNNNIDDGGGRLSSPPPSSANLKPRQAAPYSYQPRERTEIVPKSAKVRSNNFPNRNPNGIYDVSYRVITPSYDEKNNQDDGNYDDENWDF